MPDTGREALDVALRQLHPGLTPVRLDGPEDSRVRWKEWAFERWEERAPRSRGPVKALSWSPRWIPLLAHGAGDFVCVDLDPPEEGTPGQLLTVHHDDPERIRMTRGLTSWLTRFADRLESGEYRYDREQGIHAPEPVLLDDLIDP